jgi:hypothetical protein
VDREQQDPGYEPHDRAEDGQDHPVASGDVGTLDDRLIGSGPRVSHLVPRRGLAI